MASVATPPPALGKVILVGAGPGDPDLLTLKAVQALRSADVILLDNLVHPEVLQHARPDVKIIPVGKRGGCKSTPQVAIEQMMYDEVHAGKIVVRLKGGDPFVFGRGGEERDYLLAHGITVEVVNGLTSGMVAPSVCGIPLTHRDHSQGVVFVTGHGKDAAATPNWPALVASRMTLVIYMGMTRSAEIQRALLAAGMSGAMPIAIVHAATLAQQRVVLTRLQALAQTIATENLHSPSIIVVGEVVRCAAT